MNDNQFDSLARESFGAALDAAGFSCEKSRHCCFYREAAGGVFHFILPDLGSGGTWYDVRVFASSQEIEPDFLKNFPDDLGIPNGTFSYLNPRSGVGPDQKRFHCKTQEGFLRGFKEDVEDALSGKALPYLDRIQSLSDFIPYIRQDLYKGIALFKVGEKDMARPFLNEEIHRLSSIEDSTGRVASLLRFTRDLLDT